MTWLASGGYAARLSREATSALQAAACRSASGFARRWRSLAQTTGARSRPAFPAGATSSAGTREYLQPTPCAFQPQLATSLWSRRATLCTTPSSCRWIYKLSPAIDRSPFTPAEDAHIVTQQHELGNRWAAISRGLTGRTDSMVQRRWKQLVVRCLRRLSPDATLADKLAAIGRLRQDGPAADIASALSATSDSVTVKPRGRRKAGAASSTAAGARVAASPPPLPTASAVMA